MLRYSNAVQSVLRTQAERELLDSMRTGRWWPSWPDYREPADDVAIPLSLVHCNPAEMITFLRRVQRQFVDNLPPEVVFWSGGFNREKRQTVGSGFFYYVTGTYRLVEAAFPNAVSIGCRSDERVSFVHMLSGDGTESFDTTPANKISFLKKVGTSGHRVDLDKDGRIQAIVQLDAANRMIGRLLRYDADRTFHTTVQTGHQFTDCTAVHRNGVVTSGPQQFCQMRRRILCTITQTGLSCVPMARRSRCLVWCAWADWMIHSTRWTTSRVTCGNWKDLDRVWTT